MSHAMWKKVLIAGLVLSAAGLIGSGGSSLIGQEKEKKAKGRLPAYYSDLVTEQQRSTIYAIQAKYQARITALNEELLNIEKQQDFEVENVLTAEQKSMLKKAQEEGAAKRKKNAAEKAEKKAAEEAKAAAPAEVKKAVKK
jgi:DNA replication initiation complex subunit (GINS family)